MALLAIAALFSLLAVLTISAAAAPDTAAAAPFGLQPTALSVGYTTDEANLSWARAWAVL